MVDPLTLSALGTAALTEGVRFLYEQATELLRRRRDSKAKELEQSGTSVAVPALEGQLAPLVPNPAVLARHQADLREVRRTLQDYVEEIEPIDPSDRGLLVAAEEIRRLLEAIYGQRITFRGELRPASGPLVEGEIEVTTVVGEAAAVQARSVTGSATVRGVVRAQEVTGTGKIVGVSIDRIGDA